ncbi:hypothetical protein ONS96_008442 [Cadophora gregata f. sp. sojae]|nr:hypothetical protein ONS96_008442 [Cadophora gregata f. sp. sojae]
MDLLELRNEISRLVLMYQEGNTGECYDNVGLSTEMYAFDSGQIRNDRKALQELRNLLLHRLDILACGDDYVKALDVSPPDGMRCAEWGGTSTVKPHEDDRYDEVQKNCYFADEILFPKPKGIPLRQVWAKGYSYMVYSLARSDLTIPEIRSKVEALVRQERRGLRKRELRRLCRCVFSCFIP